jgi:predicted nucleotidyltransferase
MTTKNKILVTIQSNKAKLSALGVSRIGLFGSYVRNEQSPNTDSVIVGLTRNDRVGINVRLL